MDAKHAQAGNKVVKLIIGGGFEVASIATIEHLDEQTNTVYLNGCDEDYSRDSVYAYDLKTGQACQSYIPGFSSRIVMLEE
jgi:hypothetical protein